jgi:hypothetical protein
MEFLQKEVGALLQDCEDTREGVLTKAQRKRQQSQPLPHHLRKIALSCTKQRLCPRWCSQML